MTAPTWGSTPTTDYRGSSSSTDTARTRARTMDEPTKTTGRQAENALRYTTLGIDLPEITWEGLDEPSRAKLLEQYSSLGSMMQGMLEASLLDPNLFQFILRLVKTNLDMIAAENAAHIAAKGSSETDD